ncbi:MAG: IS1595 family transposase [Chitinophagaceae bacterium]|jgi:hypothetical protein
MLNEDFFRQFPDEQACKVHFKKQRDARGIICKNCGSVRHFWMANQEKWQCYDCKSRTSLTGGTLMHRSKMSLYDWYRCMHYITTTKTIAFSAFQMMRNLGLKHHKSVWEMMHKIRVSMGNRDAEYKLQGEMEIDDAFFEVVMHRNIVKDGKRIKVDKNDEPYVYADTKRGRGTQNKRPVMVMVESRATKTTNPNKKDRQMGFVKMVAMDGLKENGIAYEIVKAVDRNSMVISDKYPSYSVLKELVVKHAPEVVESKDAMKKLPWVHTTISNAKRKFLGTYHSVNDKYLQNYLNEFVYKLNRSDFTRDQFEGLFNVAVSKTWN